MAFVVIGVLLVLLKWLEIGPFETWSWWWVVAPFGLAVVWWAWADSTGLTQKRAIARMDRRKAERRERDLERLGMGPRRDGKKK